MHQSKLNSLAWLYWKPHFSDCSTFSYLCAALSVFWPVTLQKQAWAISGFPVSWLSELDGSVRVHITLQPAPLLHCTLMTHPSITGEMCVYARTSVPSRIKPHCSERLQLRSANLQTLVLIGPEWKFRFGFEKWISRGHPSSVLWAVRPGNVYTELVRWWPGGGAVPLNCRHMFA